MKEYDSSKDKIPEQEDDGRTIVNMNVEGMPWYVRGDEERDKGASSNQHDQMTDEEARMYKWAAVKAALLVVLVFGILAGADYKELFQKQ